MITIHEKTVGIWFIGISDKQDWLAGLTEVEPDSKYLLQYRFRYHNDDKIFDSKDKKNWYEGTVSGTRNYCLLSLRNVAQELALRAGGQTVYEILNEGNMEDFMRRFQDMPFAFARTGSLTNNEKKGN